MESKSELPLILAMVLWSIVALPVLAISSSSFHRTDPSLLDTELFFQLGAHFAVDTGLRCSSICGRNELCLYFLHHPALNRCIMVGTAPEASIVISSSVKDAYRLYAQSISCTSNGVYVPQMNKCLKLHTDSPLSWVNARDKCLQDGGYLMHINSDTELQRTRAYFQSVAPAAKFFIGAQMTNNALRWDLTGQVVKASWFYTNQPDNWFGDEYCVGIHASNDYYLADFGCVYYPTDYVCEFPFAE